MIGHILRYDDLLKLVIEGYVVIKTKRWKPNIKYIPPILTDIWM